MIESGGILTKARRSGACALLIGAWVLCGSAGPLPAADAESAPLQTIVVRPGDTMWSIANKYLKDPKRWDEILKHNRLPSKNPTVALPGMTLRVPILLIKEELRAARLVHKRNDVLFRRQDTAAWKPAQDKMELFRDDAIRTLKDSMARVSFIDQGTLQVDPNSMAVIRPLKKDYDVYLQSGGVFVGRAKVVTVSAKIIPRSKDTTYSAEVKADLSTKVQVYKGRATVESEGESVEVGEGMATEVKIGRTPLPPFQVPNLPDFEARAAEFSGDFRLLRAKAGIATPITTSILGASGSADAPRVEDIYGDVNAVAILSPIAGYRVQFSNTEDFNSVVFDKSFDIEDKIQTSDVKLGPGRYWVRMATIDLLGTPSGFQEPKLFVLGASTLKAVQAFKSGVMLLRPAVNNLVSFSSRFRVMGRSPEDLTVLVNDKQVRVDENNYFSVEVDLSPGNNQIRVTSVDKKGNADHIQRTVIYRRP